MNRRIVFLSFILAVLMVPLITSEAREAYELTDITEDGHIHDDDPGKTRTNDTETMHIHYNSKYRGYIEFDISALNENITLTRVQLRFTSSETSYSGDIDFYKMTNQPSISSDGTVYNDARNGILYTSSPYGGEINVTYTVDLGSDAVSFLQEQHDNSDGWFALGMYSAPNNNYIYTSESSYPPLLLLDYRLPDDLNYTFHGLYWENGTRNGAVNVTMTSPSLVETFIVDGSTNEFYSEQPVVFRWALETGVRHLYSPIVNETFYLFWPDDTYSVYDFIVKDFTGKLGEGSSYLELYKVANTTEYLIERMIIHDVMNTVPVYMVVGHVYHLKILWNDGTRYNWGYYVAGGDSNPILSVRNPTFDQQTQMTYEYLRVTATRPTLTLINVDYEDTLDQTNWVNITISPRLGVVEHSESSNRSSKVFNWAGATNTTDYKVIVYIDHVKFGLKTVVLYADTTKVYDDFLDPEVLGSYGALSTGNLIAFSLAVIFMGAFSYEFGSTAGIVSGLTIVSLMTFWGATTYTYNFLALCWFVGIIMILRVVKT